MGNYLLFFIASLALAPWGLCLPRGHDALEARQALPGTNTCPAGPTSVDLPVWIPRSDAYISIQVAVDTSGLKGYFLLVVDAESGVAYTSSSHLASADVDISPYYEAGMTKVSEDASVSNYQIWIDSVTQTTPNFYNTANDYNFAGVWPRVDMQINRTTHTEYLTAAWPNFAQGAVSVNLVDYELFSCGKGQ